MCKSETSGAKYRCQCALITITFYNQNYNTLIFKWMNESFNYLKSGTFVNDKYKGKSALIGNDNM